MNSDNMVGSSHRASMTSSMRLKRFTTVSRLAFDGLGLCITFGFAVGLGGGVGFGFGTGGEGVAFATEGASTLFAGFSGAAARNTMPPMTKTTTNPHHSEVPFPRHFAMPAPHLSLPASSYQSSIGGNEASCARVRIIIGAQTFLETVGPTIAAQRPLLGVKRTSSRVRSGAFQRRSGLTGTWAGPTSLPIEPTAPSRGVRGPASIALMRHPSPHPALA